MYSVDVVENRPMSLTDFKAYADKRAPFPSSTANAGFPGCPAGVRRGRSSGLSTHEVWLYERSSRRSQAKREWTTPVESTYAA